MDEREFATQMRDIAHKAELRAAENQACEQYASVGTANLGKAVPPTERGYDQQAFGMPGQHPTEEITLENVDSVMKYQPWDIFQAQAGDIVREALTLAAKAILRHVPRSPRRTLAIQHLVDARMDANAAISFRGRF